MKNKCLTLFFALCFVLVLCQSVLAAEGLKDINGHWAQVQIEKWATDGLIAGYTDGQFRPDDPITRSEFVSLVNQAYKIEKSDTLYPFSDVKPSDWFYSQVMSGRKAGYITGYPDGTFRPNHNISRQEAAVLITKLLDLPFEEQTTLVSFKDYPGMDQWAQASINTVIAHGIMSGFPDKTFKAQNNITRAEAVATLERSLSYPNESDTGAVPGQIPSGGGGSGGGDGGGGGDIDNNQPKEDDSDMQQETPAINRTVATNLFTSTAFLYSGDNPIQTDMASDTIEQKRAAVIRGRVLTGDGSPLRDVRITVLNHSEFGSTVSGSDGYFDMAVNGGSQFTVHYEKEGYITAQRQVDVPWQDFAILLA